VLRRSTLIAIVVGFGSAFTLRAIKMEVKRGRIDFGEEIIIQGLSVVINPFDTADWLIFVPV
jgi:hypothetical protein